jgi:MFS family permease
MGGLHIVLSFGTRWCFCDHCTSALKMATTNIANHVRQPIQLIICLGPLYGIGAGMLFAPTINYMSEWFDKKKSLAYGIMYVE